MINLTVSIFVVELPRTGSGDKSRPVSIGSEDDFHVHIHNHNIWA